MFDRQDIARAVARAWAKTGKRIAARMAIIAITTSSSISVNPRSELCVLIKTSSNSSLSRERFLARDAGSARLADNQGRPQNNTVGSQITALNAGDERVEAETGDLGDGLSNGGELGLAEAPL